MAFTFFFRDINTLESGVEKLLDFSPGKSKIKVWDAGCAMGQEPYSLAILLSERMGQFSFRNLSITATDIDVSNLFEKFIGEGIYSKEELNRVSKNILAKYFEEYEEQKKYQIKEFLRRKVKFIRHDLLTLNPVDKNFSLIVCKNVLLHFSAEDRIKVLKMFYDSLEDGGILMIEQTQKMPEEMDQYFSLASNNSQIYKKKN